MHFARSVTNSIVGGETSEKAATTTTKAIAIATEQHQFKCSFILISQSNRRYETACTRYLVLSSDDRMIVQV